VKINNRDTCCEQVEEGRTAKRNESEQTNSYAQNLESYIYTDFIPTCFSGQFTLLDALAPVTLCIP
jgi:hypothetical protein